MKRKAGKTAGAVTGGRRASSVDSQIAKAKEQIKLNQSAANE